MKWRKKCIFFILNVVITFAFTIINLIKIFGKTYFFLLNTIL